jgi:enoyl-CoA hydratase/carnithine racemase
MDESGVADVALVRADKMNALDTAMFDALLAAIDGLHRDPRLRAVVLHGEGRAFCAGLDMATMQDLAEGRADDRLRDLEARTHGIANGPQYVAWGWRELPVPVVAAVHGVAFGGGFQIALGADVRYATADLRMSAMEIQWGLIPDMAGCVLLSELVRADQARELVFSGRIVSAVEAQAFGLVTHVCDDPLAQARALAAQIATRSPEAVRAAKRLLNQASAVRAAEVLRAESVEQKRLIGSESQREAVRAAAQKRAPAGKP